MFSEDAVDEDDIKNLFENNQRWARTLKEGDPGFFARLAEGQKPNYLWIGCSDSRVPANQITGLPPGELFVHRNVANVILETDINCMSVVDFAIRHLQVRHVIVCGHYGCGGIEAAMGQKTEGVIDQWLSGIRELWQRHRSDLRSLGHRAAASRLCELNVQHQVETLCHSTVLRQAWHSGQFVNVHGWIYGVQDGLLRKLGLPIGSLEGLSDAFG